MAAQEKLHGTQLLVPQHLLDRARALAIVRGESVAGIWRQAIEHGGLSKLERTHEEALLALHVKINISREDKSETLAAMVKAQRAKS